MNEIYNKRKERLIGKYIIISNSKHDNDVMLFLQDDRYGSGYWTKYIQNAIGYTHLEDAINRLNTINYNNPLIAIMDTNYKLITIVDKIK